MNIFSFISLFGGLAMFLYGMRMLSSGMKEASSGTLKKTMERFTTNQFTAFLLGVLVTALIQSSTATIVITAGLVAAGIIRARNSIGIIMGANVGTTITGQVIRLLDLDESSSSVLQIFKPSTLAPAAMIAGIVLIMFCKFSSSDMIGNTLMGFGILFSGLINMTGAVSTLNESGIFERMFVSLGNQPVAGYAVGFAVAFTLQSSSASVGILQALSTSGQLTFRSIYPILAGIYLGDCVTTAIVCSIGAKAEAKRVGMINLFYNLGKTFVVFIAVLIFRQAGLLDGIWNAPITSGGIANTNTVFNLGAVVLLFPLRNLFVIAGEKVVKDDPVKQSKYEEKLAALNPVFFSTPALAFRSCYDVLMAMFGSARSNIELAINSLFEFSADDIKAIREEEEEVDRMCDQVSNYLVQFSPHLVAPEHVKIMDQYYKVVVEFERLSDHALNIAEVAENMHNTGSSFSDPAVEELKILSDLLYRILDYTGEAFANRDAEAAKHIEPLEEVVDDLIYALRDNHLARMKNGKCSVETDADFSNLMSDMERISDVCSDVGVATVARVYSDEANLAHSYISYLHQGRDENYNAEYDAAHSEFFGRLAEIEVEDHAEAEEAAAETQAAVSDPVDPEIR